jgi:tripartite-type tricarboxylate transporter receptor subunit TctC
MLPIIAGFDEAKMEAWLKARGVRDTVAHVLAQALRSPEWQALMERRFYTKTAMISLDKDNGVSVRIEASNYILSRVARDTR